MKEVIEDKKMKLFRVKIKWSNVDDKKKMVSNLMVFASNYSEAEYLAGLLVKSDEHGVEFECFSVDVSKINGESTFIDAKYVDSFFSSDRLVQSIENSEMVLYEASVVHVGLDSETSNEKMFVFADAIEDAVEKVRKNISRDDYIKKVSISSAVDVYRFGICKQDK